MVRVKSTPRKVEQASTSAAAVEGRFKVGPSVKPTQIVHPVGQAPQGQEQQQQQHEGESQEQGQSDAAAGSSGSGKDGESEDSKDADADAELDNELETSAVHFEILRPILVKNADTLEEYLTWFNEVRMKCFIERKIRKKNGRLKVFHYLHIYELTLEDKWNEISKKILPWFRIVKDKSGNVQSYHCKRCLALVTPTRRAVCGHAAIHCMRNPQNFRPRMYEDFAKIREPGAKFVINICRNCGKVVKRNYHRLALHVACCGRRRVLNQLQRANHAEYIRRQRRRLVAEREYSPLLALGQFACFTTMYGVELAECRACGKRMAKERLKLHTKSHLQPKIYKCKSCKKNFTKRLEYISHILVDFVEKQAEAAMETESENEMTA